MYPRVMNFKTHLKLGYRLVYKGGIRYYHVARVACCYSVPSPTSCCFLSNLVPSPLPKFGASRQPYGILLFDRHLFLLRSQSARQLFPISERLYSSSRVYSNDDRGTAITRAHLERKRRIIRLQVIIIPLPWIQISRRERSPTKFVYRVYLADNTPHTYCTNSYGRESYWREKNFCD